MNLLVGREVRFGRKALSASFARVLRVLGVHVLEVGLEARKMAELLAAVSAVERFRICRKGNGNT